MKIDVDISGSASQGAVLTVKLTKQGTRTSFLRSANPGSLAVRLTVHLE